MTKRYTPFHLILLFALFVSPNLMSANGAPDNGGPATADSLTALRGHCNPLTIATVNCATRTITLSAYISWTFTGQLDPYVATWNTGQTAQSIVVVPPGTWNWDASGTGCEPNHWNTDYIQTGSFFNGNLQLISPGAICAGGSTFINVNTDGYTFNTYVWSPPNLGGQLTPYEIYEPGLYSLTVTDDIGCPFVRNINIPLSPPVQPTLSGPQRLCSEGNTGTVQVNQAWSGYEWGEGQTTNPITVDGPGLYTVTVTNQFGCTGVGAWGVQNADVDPFPISMTAPAICVGQPDTLRVVGGFSNYTWSNGASGITNIVTNPGTYFVTVTNIWGCTGTGSVTVAPLPTPSPTLASTPLCPGDTSTLTVGGGSFPNYTWSNGATGNPVNIVTAGTYTVTVSGAGFCATSTSIAVAAQPAPTVEIAPPNQLDCVVPQTPLDATNSSDGPEFALQWSTIGGHFVSGDTTLMPTVDAPGAYILKITNTITGCVSADTVTVNTDVVPPPTPVGPPGTLTCAITTYGIGPALPPADTTLIPSWATSGGNFVGGQDTWAPTVDQPGTYILTVTNPANSCTATASVVVSQDILDPNAVAATPDLLTCTMNTVALDGSASSSGPNFTYLWTTANGTIVGDPTTPVTTAASVGTYQLLVTNTANGCTSTTSVNVAADVNIPTTSALPPATLTCSVNTVTIDASASSSGPTFTYTWTGPNPNSIVSGQGTLTPTVNAPGTYQLLLFNSANSCSATLSVNVPQDIVPPVASAGPSATLNCVVLSLNLNGTASSTGANFTHQWSTQNGNIVSGANTLTPTVNMAGTYTLVVTNTTNNCTSSASVQILNDTDAPVALINNPATLTCTTLQTAIDANASSQGAQFQYSWSGPGIVGGQGTLQPTVDQPGTYTLSIVNTVNGCTDTEAVTVPQDIVPPVALAGNDGIINCFTPTGTIGSTANPSGPNFSLQWSTPDGNFTSPTNGPTATVDAPGTYTLFITNTANGCTDTDEVIVQDDFTPPAADAGQPFVLNCLQPVNVLQGTGSTGPNFTYQWSTTNGNIVSGANTLTPSVDASGIYTLVVSNTTNGCSTSASVQILNDINAPVALINTPATLTCATLQTVIDASISSQGPDYQYTWSGPGIVGGQGTLQPTVNQPGTYTLSIVNTVNGCTDTESVNVPQDIVPPAALAGNDGIINCFSPTGAIGSTANPSGPNITLQWSTMGGNFTSPTNGPTATVDAPGTYTLLVTNTANGCTSTDAVVVQADFVPPTADAGPTFEINCVQTSVVLQGSGSTGANFTYQWTTTNGNIVSGDNTLTPTVNLNGNYNLLITNTVNGCQSTDNVDITINATLPTVAIAAPPTLTCVLTSLNLNANGTSTGATFNYTWSTQNGNIVSGGNTLAPTVNAPGTYTLTVVNTANQCSSSANINVAQNIQNPVVDAGNPTLLTCTVLNAPLQATILSSSSPNISYVWSTQNGNIVSGGNTPAPVVNQPGLYTVVVTDAANGCTHTDNVQINQDIVNPTISIAQPATLTCTLLQTPINATASSAGPQFTYQWTTPNGNIVSGNTTNQPIVNAPGTYNLLVTNTSNGCTQTGSTDVPQDIALPTANAGPQVGLNCVVLTNTLNGTSSSTGTDFSYNWTTANGQIVSGGTTLTPTIGAPGTYVLTVLNTTNGCQSTSSVVVTEDVTLPSFSIAQPQQLTCVVPTAQLAASGTNFGPSPTFTWTTNDGNIVSGGSTLNATVNAPGTYVLTIVNTVNGCTQTQNVQVLQDIAPPPVQTQPVPPLTCTVKQRTLQATAPAQALLLWTTQNGSIVSGANTPNLVVDEPGLYVVTATLPSNGCTSSASVSVLREQNVPTGLDLALDPPKCTGVLGLLEVEQIVGGFGPYQYSIDGGATFFPAKDIDGLKPGTYSLVVRDANGCTIARSIDVPAPPVPAVNLPPSFSIELGEDQVLQAVIPPSFNQSLIQQVIWSPAESLTFAGNSIAQQLNPTAKPFVTTEYKVTILTAEGCRAEARTIIRVDRNVGIYPPNVIWPETSDGKNYAFTLYAKAGTINQIRSLQVYDRWGEQLWVNRNFLPNDPDSGWKGDFRGQLVNPGVFVWWAEVELIDGQVILMKGDVTVVR